MNTFIIIGKRLCNLENVDDISFEYLQEKKISMPHPPKSIKCAWDVMVLYKSGNAVTETIVEGEYSNEDEFEVLAKQFEDSWIGLINLLVGDGEEEKA